MIDRPPPPLADLAGMVLTLGTSAGMFQGVANQLQQAAGPDTFTTVQMSGAVVALVGALTFIHRLLMKAKEETLSRSEAGFLGTLASKDDTIRFLKDQLDRAELTEAKLRDQLTQKEEAMVTILTTFHQTAGG